jgi:hypothetical protein
LYNHAVGDEQDAGLKQAVTSLYRLARLEELVETHFKRLYELVRACAESADEGITGEARQPHAPSRAIGVSPLAWSGLTATFSLLFRDRSIAEFRCVPGRRPEPRPVIGYCEITDTETRQRLATFHLTKRNGNADWDVPFDDDTPPGPVSAIVIFVILKAYADKALERYGVTPSA